MVSIGKDGQDLWDVFVVGSQTRDTDSTLEYDVHVIGYLSSPEDHSLVRYLLILGILVDLGPDLLIESLKVSQVSHEDVENLVVSVLARDIHLVFDHFKMALSETHVLLLSLDLGSVFLDEMSRDE